MENKEFFAALTDLVKEKGISEEAFITTLENALASAYKKQFEGGAEISVSLNAELGTIDFSATRYVVAEVEDKDKEISLEDAQALDARHQIGDKIVKNFIPKNFGRIAAQSPGRQRHNSRHKPATRPGPLRRPHFPPPRPGRTRLRTPYRPRRTGHPRIHLPHRLHRR